MITPLEYLWIALAACAAGVINALAGGGTLITFPVLTAVGMPAVAANVTNTVALCPGPVGGIFGQAKDLRGQRQRLWMLIPAGIVGGLLGGILLLSTSERLFRQLVPFLILLASLLLAIQGRLRIWLSWHISQSGKTPGAPSRWLALPVGLASVYGGYFGAGLGVILMAVLGLVIDDNLTRLNALKQVLALAANLTAAIFFLFSGQVHWTVALVMAFGALLGGVLGGQLAGRIPPATLRWVVVGVGVVVAVVYWVR